MQITFDFITTGAGNMGKNRKGKLAGNNRPLAKRRKWDTGTVRPYRPCPADFRETFLEMGWDGIEDHYRTNYRVIARWIEESGGDELRAERAEITGSALKPHLRSKRYKGGKIALDDRKPLSAVKKPPRLI